MVGITKVRISALAQETKGNTMKAKLCLVALTLALGLAIVQPTAVLATNTESTEEKKPNCDRKRNQDFYKDAMDKWNKLTDQQKQEIYKIMESRNKADAQMLDKMAEFGVVDTDVVKQIKAGMDKMYKDMKDKGEFPIMRPRRQ